MTEVEQAEKTIRDLDDKRRQLVERRIVLEHERQQSSYSAHTGDKTARAKLDKLNLEHATFESEFASVEAAIKEAQSRLAAAQRTEASAADREKAKAIAVLNAQLKEQLEDADAAAADFISSILSARDKLQELHSLGVTSPTDQMFRINAVAGIKTVIQLLPQPWINDFEFARLAPSQKKEFKQLAEAWGLTIENQIAARIPQPKKTEAA
jgi:hypothetical protein